MRTTVYTPKEISKCEKIFLPDHPASDMQGFVSIDHPGLISELTCSIEKRIKSRSPQRESNLQNKVSNKISDKY
jgi:hypothetical protein